MIPVICQVLSSFPQAKLANLVQEKLIKLEYLFASCSIKCHWKTLTLPNKVDPGSKKITSTLDTKLIRNEKVAITNIIKPNAY